MSTTPVLIRPVRNINWQAQTSPSGSSFPAGTIFADAVVEERSDDENVITENPVENGSVSSDHAYNMPALLELTYAWAPASSQNSSQDPNFLNTIYQQLLNLKKGRILFSVLTGKRQYQNMLVKHLSQTTNKDTENVLLVRMVCQELILAVTQTVTISSSAQQALPQKTSPTINSGTQNLGPAKNFNTGSPTGS